MAIKTEGSTPAPIIPNDLADAARAELDQVSGQQSAGEVSSTTGVEAESHDAFVEGTGQQTQTTDATGDTATGFEQGLQVGEGSVLRGEHVPMESGTRAVPVEPGQSWDAVLGEHYGTPVSPTILAAVARLNGVSPTDDPPSVLTIYGTEQIYRALQGDDVRPFVNEPGTTFLVVREGESWADVAYRHYGDNISPEAAQGLGFILSRLNTSGDRLACPRGVVAVPDGPQMRTMLERVLQRVEQMPEGHLHGEELGPISSDAQARVTEMGGSLSDVSGRPTPGQAYRAGDGESLRDVTINAYYQQLIGEGMTPEAAEAKLADYMLVIGGINDLQTTHVGRYDAIWLPPVERLDNLVAKNREEGTLTGIRQSGGPFIRVITRQARGALDDARALADGNVPSVVRRDSHTGGPPRAESIEAAIATVQAKHIEDRQSQFGGSFMPFLGNLGTIIAAVEMNVAEAEASGTRREGESVEEYVDRTSQHLTVEEREQMDVVAGKVAAEMAMLQEFGLVDANGRLTFEITDPSQIAYEVYKATAGKKIDPMLRTSLITRLQAYAATHANADGQLTEPIDVAQALIDGAPEKDKQLDTPFNWSSDSSLLVLIEQSEQERAQPLLDEGIDQGTLADTGILAMSGQIRAHLADNGVDFESMNAELRSELMANINREAEALALLKKDVKEFDALVKFAAEQIEQDLAQGKRVGGTPMSSQTRRGPSSR